MAERHDDLGPGSPLTQELDDLSAQQVRRVGGDGGHPIGVEQDHAGPTDLLAPSIGGLERHHEEVALVIERVLAIRKVG
jgi:hypothetical protein